MNKLNILIHETKKLRTQWKYVYENVLSTSLKLFDKKNLLKKVWVGLGVSIICVISVLNLMQRYLEYRSTVNKNSNENLVDGQNAKKRNKGKHYLYVFGNLLSQGLIE